MAMCEEKYSNSNELGKGCIHFEVDKDDECVCALDELETKLQALREEKTSENYYLMTQIQIESIRLINLIHQGLLRYSLLF